MTTVVELAGYQPVFSNAVYSRMPDETETVMTPEGEKALAFRTFIIIGRYQQPTEDSVVKYLRETATKITCGLKLPPGVEPTDMSPLEKIMRRALPDKILTDITTGNQNCLDFIRKNTPAPKKGEEQPYLRIRAGTFPVELIDDNEKANAIQNAEWYDGAFLFPKFTESGFGERWKLTIKLEEGKLPHIEHVYNPATEQAKTVRVSTRGQIPFADISHALDVIYVGIDTPEKILAVQDITEQVLNENTLPPINAFQQMLAQQQAQALAARMQMEQLRKLGGRKP